MASIIVVGGGFAGMSTAARLAKMRHEVQVLEASPHIGGRLLGVEIDEVTWRTAPMAVTLPGVFRDLFRKSGRAMTAILDLVPAEPRRHVVVGRRGTTVLDLPFGTRSAQHDAVTAAFGSDPWSPWLDEHADIWDITRHHVLGSVVDTAGIDAIRSRLDLGRNAQQSARQGLKHRDLEAIATDRWRLAGVDPRQMPALWQVWHYVERNFGLWRFADDHAGLLRALTQRLEERKVPVELNTPVHGVRMKFGRVTGVDTAAGPREADIVVWASGQGVQGFENPVHTPTPLNFTGLELHEDLLPNDLIAHGRTRLRVWSSGSRRWVVATKPGTDLAEALGTIGVPRDAVRSFTPLASPHGPLPDAGTSGSGRAQERERPRPRPVPGRADPIPRPAMSPAEGLYIVGGAAVPGAGLEVTGMGTAAVASAIGPVTAVQVLGDSSSD